jgi:hypothetical protein
MQRLIALTIVGFVLLGSPVTRLAGWLPLRAVPR